MESGMRSVCVLDCFTSRWNALWATTKVVEEHACMPIENGKAQPSTNHERNRIMTDSQGTTFPAFTERRVQHGGGSL